MVSELEKKRNRILHDAMKSWYEVAKNHNIVFTVKFEDDIIAKRFEKWVMKQIRKIRGYSIEVIDIDDNNENSELVFRTAPENHIVPKSNFMNEDISNIQAISSQVRNHYDKSEISAGQLVKVRPELNGLHPERFWVTVIHKDKNFFVGQIENDLTEDFGYNCGDKCPFKYTDIVDVWKN